MLKKITGFKELTICEDCTEHYDYWREHVNPNKDDCCNLRQTENIIEYLSKKNND